MTESKTDQTLDHEIKPFSKGHFTYDIIWARINFSDEKFCFLPLCIELVIEYDTSAVKWGLNDKALKIIKPYANVKYY